MAVKWIPRTNLGGTVTSHIPNPNSVKLLEEHRRFGGRGDLGQVAIPDL